MSSLRMPYSSIAVEALPPRLSVLGYVKVGGLEPKIRFTRAGKPWVAPMRYTDPVRFEVTTREQRIKEVKGQGQHANETFKVRTGYVRDEQIHGEIGAQPTELDVRFMFPRWQDNFVCHFGAHNGKKWICQGNGVEALDIQRGQVPCTCPRLKQFEGTYAGPKPPETNLVPCKPHGVLSFILPAANSYGGFHAFKTTSYESIANLATQLALFERQFERLDGLPFKLLVYPATKGYGEGEGMTTQPIVTVVIAASFDTARQIGAAAAAESRRFLLSAGGAPDPVALRTVLEREMVEEAENEGAEFFSENAETESNGNGNAHSAAANAGKTPLAEINERIRAKREGKPLPVVQADASPAKSPADEGADYEVVDDGAEEPADGEPEHAGPVAEVLAAVKALEELRDRALEANIGLTDDGVASIADAIKTLDLKKINAWTKTLENRFEKGPEEPEPEPRDDGPRGSLTGKTRDALNREYFAVLGELAPDLAANEDQRRLWQAQNVGKSSCSQWDPDDYELALGLLRKGRTKVELGGRVENPNAKAEQTRML